MGAPFSSTKYTTSRPASVSLCLVNINTISEWINSDRSAVLVSPVRETAKAIAVGTSTSKRLAWLPKSQCRFLRDDFYTNEPQDKWAVPAWLANRAAAELGTFAWRIND